MAKSLDVNYTIKTSTHQRSLARLSAYLRWVELINAFFNAQRKHFARWCQPYSGDTKTFFPLHPPRQPREISFSEELYFGPWHHNASICSVFLVWALLKFFHKVLKLAKARFTGNKVRFASQRHCFFLFSRCNCRKSTNSLSFKVIIRYLFGVCS